MGCASTPWARTTDVAAALMLHEKLAWLLLRNVHWYVKLCMAWSTYYSWAVSAAALLWSSGAT